MTPPSVPTLNTHNNVGSTLWHHILKILHMSKDYLCAISKNSVEQFWRRRFLKGFALNLLRVKIVFGYYLIDNVGDTTILYTLKYTYPKTFCVQYLRNMLSSFGEEDFPNFCKQKAKFLHFIEIQSSDYNLNKL